MQISGLSTTISDESNSLSYNIVMKAFHIPFHVQMKVNKESHQAYCIIIEVQLYL